MNTPQKIVLAVSVSLLLAVSSIAQVPPFLNYQGLLTDNEGAPLDTVVDLTFDIYEDEGGTILLWSETHVNVQITDGLFDMGLGELSPFPEELWTGPIRFVGIKIDGGQLALPLTPVISVAYAIRSNSCGMADLAHSIIHGSIGTEHIIDNSIEGEDIFHQGASPGQVLKWTGSSWAPSDDNIGGGSGGWVDDGDVVKLATLSDFVGVGTSSPQYPLHVVGPILSGYFNEIYDTQSAIAGGNTNYADSASFIGGGEGNSAIGMISTVGGGWQNFVYGRAGTIGGGQTNYIDGGSTAATIAGGESNFVDTAHGTIAGGLGNYVAGQVATVGGGYADSATGDYSMVAGGHTNHAGGSYSVVSGGHANHADSARSTIGGGYANRTGGGATVGGGLSNTAEGFQSTVAGGEVNHAQGWRSTVSGGYADTASADYATVGGGGENVASGGFSTVGGGSGNSASGSSATIAGGFLNIASANSSTVCGGVSNEATSNYSTVLGGNGNIASGYNSLAAGYYANATHVGCFIWADPSAEQTYFYSAADNEFAARVTGGVRFVTGLYPSVGVQVAAGGGSWSSISDRNVKENLSEVDAAALLKNLASLPISTWNYKTQDESVRHIGPMAQDFFAAFGVGEDDRHITSIDADGVALAAIQALYSENKQLRQEVDELKRMVEMLLKEGEQSR